MLSNDEEDMDVEPFGDPDSAGIAGLDFEGFNMQLGYAGVSSQLSSSTSLSYYIARCSIVC